MVPQGLSGKLTHVASMLFDKVDTSMYIPVTGLYSKDTATNPKQIGLTDRDLGLTEMGL